MTTFYREPTQKERSCGYVRPFRRIVTHTRCHQSFELPFHVAARFARAPECFGAITCPQCNVLDNVSEYTWHVDGSRVGS